uniref:Proteasome (Prosome, macropain) subunit, alpha type, 2 n=1 Tax=Schistosoma japonicum TaxID=6182 RepID=C1LJL9_SCHJA|nr:proteasome (prosome, macropain) subunit, alpha type, 2 [Schistosoma japonicum]
MSERYSFSLTTFSPSGKLVQIEYALKAVESGAPSVGIRAANGVVLAAVKNSLQNLWTNQQYQRLNRSQME